MKNVPKSTKNGERIGNFDNQITFSFHRNIEMVYYKSIFPHHTPFQMILSQEVDHLAALQYQALDIRYLHNLQQLWSDPAVIRYTGTPEPYTLEQTRQKLERLQQSDVFVVFQQHRFIGIVGCPCIDTKTLEFGLFYQFRQSVWGRGYATAAVKWMLAFMKKKYIQPVIYADVITQNTASEKILKRFHFICQSESKPIHSCGQKTIVRHYVLDTSKNVTPTKEAFSMQYIFTGSYTSPDGTDGVRCFSIDLDNRLTQLCAADIYSPTYVLYHHGLLYAVGRNGKGSRLHTFSFDGKNLTAISTVPAVEDSTLCHLSIVGNTLYASAYGAGKLARFRLDENGIPSCREILAYQGGSVHPRQDHAHIHSAFPSPDKHFLLVCDLGSDRIYNYCIQPDGSLLPNPVQPEIVTPAGSGPRHLTYTRDGIYVYVITELSAQVLVYQRNVQTGILTQIQITDCVPQERPEDTLSADIHLSKDEHSLYASSRGADCMAIYAVQSDGTLRAPVYTSSYASGPRNFSLSPNGQLTVIGGQYSNNIVICPIDPNTGIPCEPISETEMPQATCAQWIEIDI